MNKLILIIPAVLIPAIVMLFLTIQDDFMVQDDPMVKLCSSYVNEALDSTEAIMNDYESKNLMNVLANVGMLEHLQEKIEAEGCFGEDQNPLDSPYISKETKERVMELRERFIEFEDKYPSIFG